MKRVRRAIAMLMVLGMFTFPMKGCAGGPGGGMGVLGKLALGVATSVGTYLLIQELD